MPVRRLLLPVAATLSSGLVLAGCGGSSSGPKDEATGRYEVEVVKASFPSRQRVADPSQIVMTVKNSGRRALPDLAVTLDSLDYRSTQDGLADPSRPLWIVDAPPLGADSAYTNTWALPNVPAGQTRTLRWNVTAVKPGRHVVRWRVAAGLDGRARAVTPSGATPEGRFDVRVSGSPPNLRIDPSTGVVSGFGSGL